MDARKKKKLTAAIFMDVEKAFDKVWHSGLLHTLIKMGLPTIYIRYIKSYISNRFIYFYLNGIRSPNIWILLGIPQGSSLSAILFILYVSDIPTSSTPRSKAQTLLSQFADDIKVYTTCRSLTYAQKRLQKAINRIIIFCG